MSITDRISKHVKVVLTVLTLVSMALGIAGIWGYAGPETVGKAIGTMALIGGAVIVIDGFIYRKHELPRKEEP